MGAGQKPSASRQVPVPAAAPVAAALLLQDALATLDPKIRDTVSRQLGGVLPQLHPAGTVVPNRMLTATELTQLIPGAALAAAGLDPAVTPSPPPPVLWQVGDSELIVRPGAVTAQIGEGFVELTVPVSCDQTGDTKVTVTFMTGTADQPAGGVTTTEDHPRGPAAIVERWHEPWIAYAWSTLLVATSALAGAVGTDWGGAPLIANEIEASIKTGIGVTPMARHVFNPAAST